MCDSAVERQPRVVAVVNAIPRIMGVRRSGADLNVLGKRLPSVGTERAPELRIGIGDAVGVTCPPGPSSVAAACQVDRAFPGRRAASNLARDWTLFGVRV